MLSCKEAARLISQGHDQNIPLVKRFFLRIHLLMCRFCRRYQKQLDFIHHACRTLGESPPESITLTESVGESGLSEDAKERLKKNLTRN